MLKALYRGQAFTTDEISTKEIILDYVQRGERPFRNVQMIEYLSCQEEQVISMRFGMRHHSCLEHMSED